MTHEVAGSRIASALADISDDAALHYLRRYFGLGEGEPYTGSHFDSLQTESADRVSAADIVAVACLSIHIPAAASVRILSKQSEEVSELLRCVPKVALQELPYEEHDMHFGKESAAHRLWKLLREHHRIGPTSASKVMARKRPALIPIYDSVVARVTGFSNSDDTWRAWHFVFAGNSEFTDRLHSLRQKAGIEHIPLLRILDVVFWMHGTKGVEEPEFIDSPAVL